MKQKLTRLSALLLAMLLLVSVLACGVSARELLDPNRKCSLSMTLTFKGEGEKKPHAIKGAELSIYRVADAGFAEDGTGDEIFTYTEAFSSATADLKDLKNPELLTQVQQIIGDRKVPASAGPEETNQNGFVQFQNLAAGLYLVRMTKQDADCHNMKDFLVSMPQETEKGQKIYNVNARPKLEITQEIMSLKVVKDWKKDHPTDRPKSITVELLGNGQVADTCVLTKENNWTHTFERLSRSIEWKVQEQKVPDGYEASVGDLVKNNDGYSITITNTKKAPPPPLIQTGQLNWPVPFLAIGGCVLILAGWVISHGRRKEN